MDAPTLALVAVGLAMDALAVAIGIGLCTRERALAAAARVGFHFGVFQAGMTLAGWLGGSELTGWVDDASHWVAAALLWLVGGHMLVEALFHKSYAACDTPGGPAAPRAAARDMSRGWALLGLSVATSIDALGVGMGLGLLGAPKVWLVAAVIGAVAAVLPAAGLVAARHVAARTGERFSRAAAAAGALVLLGIGVRIAFFSG